MIEDSDPTVPVLSANSWPGGRELRSVDITDERLRSYDCVVVVTDHSTFDYRPVVACAPLVVDSRNAISTRAAHVFRVGAPPPGAIPSVLAG